MPRKKRSEGERAANGESTIYLGSDGRWHGRVTMGIGDDGKPDRRHVSRKDEDAVKDAVKELEKQRDNGTARKPGKGWTVETWLTHWVENIAAPSVRTTTMVGYRASVYKHLIPKVGAHKLHKLQPEHLEAAYRKMMQGGLKASTAHLAHRTVRAALNEAVRRRHIVINPARIAKAPRVEEEEIIPFTRDEAKQLIRAAAEIRNGTRFVVALALGLRRGEALGLKWEDISLSWKHGCPKGNTCRQTLQANECPNRRGAGTMRIRRSIGQHNWQHGCTTEKPCGHQFGAFCPKRWGGGLVVGEVKSRAGRRTIGIPHQLAEQLDAHREGQEVEREQAGDLWEGGDWVFATPIGRPTHPTPDNRSWKALLAHAGVRDGRLHDLRHTAATVLLELKVPLPAVMELMGWSNAAVAKRYMHVTSEFTAAIADQVGNHVWAVDDEGEEDDEDGPDGVPVPA
ncbi:site-specific integrase [Amycolatopsis sp. DSM 110486]|uniref:tyrosine-type recombinase/integrase n=1 Tax=Amycolatopsis sp. DSM 110486 TaxID=2865832 RepID=UPI001C696491|nr:site-specific integrase [Amycolatopsis sp. DSM 110486]QYN23749.1 site-specific integrase [Amycolatopsis sp. DSM 110486]